MNKFRRLLRVFHRYKSTVFNDSYVKRKYPVEPNLEKELPIFDYHAKNPLNLKIYVWGRPETGALGLVLRSMNYISTIRTPRRLSFAEYHDVTDITCGYGFTVFLVNSTQTTKLYGCGINTDSQLGLHVNRQNKKLYDYLLIPQEIHLPLTKPDSSNVVSVAAGRAHLLVLTDEGLFTLGNNSYGQCGRRIIEKEKYSGSSIIYRVPGFEAHTIRQINCGQDHSLVLLKNGQVYSCGWSADGQTGLGHYNNQERFQLVSGDIAGENIVKVAGNADCVLALNDKGQVFGWGNSEYAQFPLKKGTQQVHTPISLDAFQYWGKIIDIAAGGSFCLALNDEGEVFVWGYGLLGLGPNCLHTDMPLNIPKNLFGCNSFDPECKVKNIECGLNHMVALNSNGDLYTWGRNASGNLGLGHTKDQYFPLKVSIGVAVKKVSCGVDHTVCLCEPLT